MKAYRVEKQKYLKSLLHGIAGIQHSFRWNTKGNPIIYAAESKSLALLEKCANLSKPFQGLTSDYVLVSIHLPIDTCRTIQPNKLPENWNSIVQYHKETQRIGNAFVNSDELALHVPSSIVTSECNVLINPAEAQKMRLTYTYEEIHVRLLT